MVSDGGEWAVFDGGGRNNVLFPSSNITYISDQFGANQLISAVNNAGIGAYYIELPIPSKCTGQIITITNSGNNDVSLQITSGGNFIGKRFGSSLSFPIGQINTVQSTGSAWLVIV